MGLLVAVSGKARVGKDTFSKFLASALKDITKEDYTLIAYADELKRRLMEDFDLSHEQVYGDLKEEPDTRYPKKRDYSKLHEDGKLWVEKDLYWSPREIMQFIGTDCYRKVDDVFWVKAVFKRIEKDKLQNVILTDCRFKDEIDAVLDKGGFHIRILRDHNQIVHGMNHASEVSVEDDYKVDVLIDNSGSLQDLANSAKDTASVIDYLNSKKDFKFGGM